MTLTTLGITVLGIVGCGDSTTIRSVPTEPTVDLTPVQEVAWAELEGLVAKGPPAVPLPLAGLELGMTGFAATELLREVRHPNLPPPVPMEIKGRLAVGATLAAFPDVTVTLLIDAEQERVQEIDLSLPTEHALYVFTEAWGEPRMTTHETLGPVAVWSHPLGTLDVELVHAPDGRSLAKFKRP